MPGTTSELSLEDAGAIVSGGASGLGEAVVRALAARGAVVTIADLNAERGEQVAQELSRQLGDKKVQCVQTDVTDAEQVQAAVTAATAAPRGLRVAVACAGIAIVAKTVSKGVPHDLNEFQKVLAINLTGTFNLLRLAAASMVDNEPGGEGQRGVIVTTASVAAFEGQIGQIAYSASKGGIAAMTLPAARDLSRHGVRVCSVAPGIFDTPLMAGLPEDAKRSLGAAVPFPPRLGRPDEYAALVEHIVANPMLNGETIRLDGALRMAPR